MSASANPFTSGVAPVPGKPSIFSAPPLYRKKSPESAARTAEARSAFFNIAAPPGPAPPAPYLGPTTFTFNPPVNRGPGLPTSIFNGKPFSSRRKGTADAAPSIFRSGNASTAPNGSGTLEGGKRKQSKRHRNIKNRKTRNTRK